MRHPVVRMAAACAVTSLVAVTAASAQTPVASPEFGGRLMRAVFYEADPARALAALDGRVLPNEARDRLIALVQQVRGLGRAAGEAGDSGAGRADDAARDPAAALREAAWAEEHLKAHRDSPLTEYLYAFLMTRHRTAFELQGARGDAEGQKASARKYRAFLQRTRAASDPVFVWLADDIDRQPFLAVATAAHPRDFDPDT